MTDKPTATVFLTPSARREATARVWADLAAWISQWKWHAIWRARQEGQPRFQGRTWAVLSLDRRAGRLRRVPLNPDEAAAWAPVPEEDDADE
jgi:hypothetical protein